MNFFYSLLILTSRLQKILITVFVLIVYFKLSGKI